MNIYRVTWSTGNGQHEEMVTASSEEKAEEAVKAMFYLPEDEKTYCNAELIVEGA